MFRCLFTSLATLFAKYRISTQLGIAFALGLSLPLMAAILPEDRADALYHSYEGGGVRVVGPSILVRKEVSSSVSLSANYYVDEITSASIDVETFASGYTEMRKENGISADYLYQNTSISFGYTKSDESDYHAETTFFSISQDMFGELTNVSLGISQGSDVVMSNVAAPGTFAESVSRYNYKLGVSQILTKNLIVSAGAELITDNGYLNNPYRSVFYRPVTGRDLDGNPTSWSSFLSVDVESYPKTRTSMAFALRARYYLPWRAAIHGEMRFFNDTWDVSSQTTGVGYSHTFGRDWVADFRYRRYSQTAASFYDDVILGEQVYRARDKELSTFSNQSFGVTVSYEFLKRGWGFIDRASLNMSYDKILFDYKDYLDRRDKNQCQIDIVRVCDPYSFSANVLQFYASIWY